MSNLDFCVKCGCWVAAGQGTMRNGADGEAEVICGDCEAIEQSRAEPIEPGSRSGTLGESNASNREQATNAN